MTKSSKRHLGGPILVRDPLTPGAAPGPASPEDETEGHIPWHLLNPDEVLELGLLEEFQGEDPEGLRALFEDLSPRTRRSVVAQLDRMSKALEEEDPST